MAAMRAAVFDQHGGPEVVRLGEVPVPEPGPDEVRVAVRASSLNHLDLWVRRGLPVKTTLPHIGGADVAGVVDAVGPGVDRAVLGARVVVDPSLDYDWFGGRGDSPLPERRFRLLGEHTDGGFAQCAVAPAANLVTIPDGVSFETAAAAGLVFVTAWRGLLSRGGLHAGERVLVTGASGGVGTAAVQIARLAGARVFAVTSGPANVARVRALGAEVVYDRLVVDYSRELWKDTGKQGADVILDSVGEALWELNLKSLAVGGRLVICGATAGAEGRPGIRRPFWKQQSVVGATMGTREEYSEVMRLVFAGRLLPVIQEVLPLAEARRAHELLEAGEVFGKLVLVP